MILIYLVAVNNSNRLLLYSRYNHELIFENLDFILEKKYSIALSQFRLSSHDLEIKRGGYAEWTKMHVFVISVIIFKSKMSTIFY